MSAELQSISPRQMDCLRVIYRYFKSEGRYPSQREICGLLGVRSSAAVIYLAPLELKGYLRRDLVAAHRNIRLTRRAMELLRGEDASEGG